MSDAPYEKCRGMNKDGKCRAGNRHLGHKKSWLGGWYGQIPYRDGPPYPIYGKNKPRPQKKEGPEKKPLKKWWQ